MTSPMNPKALRQALVHEYYRWQRHAGATWAEAETAADTIIASLVAGTTGATVTAHPMVEWIADQFLVDRFKASAAWLATFVAPPAYQTTAVRYTTDTPTTGATGLFNNAGVKSATFVWAMRIHTAWDTNFRLAGPNASVGRFSTKGTLAAPQISFEGYGPSASIVLIPSLALPADTWFAFGMSYDVDSNIRRCVVNGASNIGADFQSGTTGASFNVAFPWNTYINQSDHDLSHVFMAEVYMDLTDPAVWAKFFDADNKPIDMGTDGTGTGLAQPAYFAPDGKLWSHGGYSPNFTGSAPDAPTSPTD